MSSAEENLLHYPGGGGSYPVLIHEWAHAIHRFGLNTVAPAFDSRLKIAYDAAMEKGLWQGTYASSDRGEYWAEGTQAWFYPKGWGSFRGNTRQALKNYDPGLAALLAEVYGDSAWRYTPIETRTHLPHLQGFDSQDSPIFQGWPELAELYQQLRNPNSNGGGRWVDLRPYDPSLLPSLNESRTRGPRTHVAFVNLTQADVLLYGVARDGTEGFWTRVPPGYIRVTGGTTNDIWLAKNSNGKNLAVFQTLEKTGRILIDAVPTLITPGLSKISGDNQTGVSGTALANPFVIEVRAENGSVLEGIAVTFTVTTGDGTLSTTRTTTDANGRAQNILTLGPNLGTNTVSVFAAGIGQPIIFNAVARAAVEIPDSNLRTAIETALGKASGAPITADEMATLTELTARDANISNLTGLEHATHLTRLELVGNNIGDVSVLTGLTKLTLLFLDNNRISNLSPLAELTRLTHLGAEGNRISDISVLAGLTSLTWLRLWDNSISNISPLAGLTQLTELYLKNNNISDISPLVENTGLGNGDQVLLNGNPLNSSSIKTYIPTLQGRGVTVEFENKANLNFGEPRQVQMIYFLPNDRPYRADVVQRMKDEIRSIQTFYAEQMGAHGHGNITFRIETDSQGEPMVHRVDGQHSNSHYYTEGIARNEIGQTFNLNANLYFIVINTDVLRRIDTGQPIGGAGARHGKIGGYALFHGEFSFGLAAHELGHGFGLWHDFRDGAYIMSYGPGQNRLSACHAEYLAMHPYFNPDTPIEDVSLPIIELISPRIYSAGSKSIPVQLKVSDSEGLHQVLLVVKTIEPHGAAGSLELKACRGLSGKKEAIVEFEYDGVIPSDGVTSLSNPVVHPIHVEVVDTGGNVTQTDFVLFSEMLQPLSKISGNKPTWLAQYTITRSICH